MKEEDKKEGNWMCENERKEESWKTLREDVDGGN